MDWIDWLFIVYMVFAGGAFIVIIWDDFSRGVDVVREWPLELLCAVAWPAMLLVALRLAPNQPTHRGKK